MFNQKLPKLRPTNPQSRAINDLSKSVSSLRDMRPVGSVGNFLKLPWGQTLLPGSDSILIAYSGPGGIPRAVKEEDGVLKLGHGEAFVSTPVPDETNEDVRLDYRSGEDTPLVVYNLASNSDGDVGGSRWIIIARIYNLWIVVWEECPEEEQEEEEPDPESEDEDEA